MKQLINLVLLTSLMHEVICNPDILDQQKSIFQKSKNIISYLPIKPSSRWDSLNNAISFGSIFGQQNSTSILTQSSLNDSQENSQPLNQEAVQTSESEQSYKNCIMKCQALASIINETLDEFSCGCDQLLKPNKIAYKYRDEYITVKKNPFHTDKPSCQNCSKTEKKQKDDTTQPLSSEGIRIKNNVSSQLNKSENKQKDIPQNVPSESINSTPSQKQISIKKNSQAKINKKQKEQQEDNQTQPKLLLNKTKSEYKSKAKQIKNNSNQQIRIKNSIIKKKQQNISSPIQEKKQDEQNEGIRIKSEQKQALKSIEIQEKKQNLKTQNVKKQTKNNKTNEIKQSEQLKTDGQIRIKNNGSINIPADHVKHTPEQETKSQEKQLKKANQNIAKQKVQKGIPIKENARYSYENQTLPILKKKNSVQFKNQTKKVYKSKNLERKNESISTKDNQQNKYQNRSKVLKKKQLKKMIKKQKKIPIKTKIVKNVTSTLKSTVPNLENDDRIRVKREGNQKEIIPHPQKKIDVDNVKQIKDISIKIEKVIDEEKIEKEIKIVKEIAVDKIIEQPQSQSSYEIRIKNNGSIPQKQIIKKTVLKIQNQTKQINQTKINQSKIIEQIQDQQIRIKNNGFQNTQPKILKINKVNVNKQQSINASIVKTNKSQKKKEIKQKKQENIIEPEQKQKADVIPSDNSIRVKNNGSQTIYKQSYKNKSKNITKQTILKVKNISIKKSQKVIKQKNISQPIEIKTKYREILDDDNKTFDNNTKQADEQKYERKKQQDLKKFEIRVKNNGNQQSALKNNEKVKNEAKINITTVENKGPENEPKDEIPSMKEDKEIKQKVIKQSDQVENKIKDVLPEDNSIRVKNNGSRKTFQKVLINVTKKKKSINNKFKKATLNISKSKQSTVNNETMIKVIKNSTNKTEISKQYNVKKQKNIVNKNNQSIRIKSNGSKKQISSIKKSSSLKNQIPVLSKVKIQKQNISIKTKKVIKNETIKENTQNKKIYDKVIQEDVTIRVKNNGLNKNTKKQQKNKTKLQNKKKSPKVIKVINKNPIITNNITIQKVNVPAAIKIIKKEVKIVDEKQEEDPLEKKKEQEIEKQYAKEIEQQQNHEIQNLKPDELSIRIKNNGTIIIKKEQKIIVNKSILNKTKDNKANDEPVPVIKDTQKYRNKVNYSKPIEDYKKSLKTYKPQPVKTITSPNITETKESIRIKNLDTIPTIINTTKISKTAYRTLKVKKSKILNKTKKTVVSTANQSVKKSKKVKIQNKNQTKQIVKKIGQTQNNTKQIKSNVTIIKKKKNQKKAELKIKKPLKNVTQSKKATKNATKIKKTSKKIKAKKIVVKNYPITNVPVHSRDIQKGDPIPMKKRKSQQKQKIIKTIKNETKITSKNITKAKKSQTKYQAIVKNVTVKKHKKQLIPVKSKIINQSITKIVKQEKKDNSIEDQPLKSVVDEIISAPLQKTINKKSINNKSMSAKKQKKIIIKKNKSQSAKKIKKISVKQNKSKTSKKINKTKSLLKQTKKSKAKQASVLKSKQQSNKSVVINKIKAVKNVSEQNIFKNTSKTIPKVVKQNVSIQKTKTINRKPSNFSNNTKKVDEIDEDDIDEPIKDGNQTEKDDDDKEECKQPIPKKTQEEISREIHVKNRDDIEDQKATGNKYKASVNYLTKNRTTTINFSDNDGTATISITNINGTQLLNVSGEKIECQSQFCKQFSSISQIFTNQNNKSMMTPINTDIGSLSQASKNLTLSKQEKVDQSQFINKKLNENSDYKEVLNNKEKLKHISFKIQKLTLLGNLMKKFYNKNDFKKEWFQKPVIFHFLEFKFVKDKPKVSIIRSIRARNLQGVIKSFKITIKDRFLKSNNTHYGIIGNSKLIFSTSSFKSYLDPKNSELLKKSSYTSTQNEFVNDNISKIFMGYGFFKQIIKLPVNFRAYQKPTLLIIDKNSYSQDIQQQSSLNLNQNISTQSNKNKFLFDGKGNLVKSSETNFKSFITLVNSFQKNGLFKAAIFDQNKLGVKIRQGQIPKGFQRQFAYSFSPRTLKQVKQRQDAPQKSEYIKENECKKFLEGSKRYQVCILNDQYRGPKQVINLSRKYNFGAIVYDPERNKISKAADILSSNMRRGLKTIQWNLIQKYIKNRKEYQFMTFSENGPLICSKKRSDKLCQLMMGYSLIQGWWKNPKLIDSQNLDQFYVIVKNLKTKVIEFINTGCDQEYAINLMKKMTQKEKNSIGGVLNSDSQLVEMTLTDPNNEKDMKYQQVYEIIGEYLSNNLQLFDKNIRNEYQANIL